MNCRKKTDNLYEENIEVICCSATTGEGMQAWYQWLEAHRVALLEKQLAPLKAKINIIEKVLSQTIVTGVAN